MKLSLKKYYSTLFLWIMCFLSLAQNSTYRNIGFSKPVNLPFNLAGSFAEPRPDHFHSGIDIKTNGVEGQAVLAIYDGYISRIRVSPYGYGKAIYITHPNGFTSVYGHLSIFNDIIEKYIHTQHYSTKRSELDLILNANIFPVQQNDTIAFSGNTGGSTAPHLHFEIRDTKTEHALNPLDFYPKDFYADTIPPQLNKVKVDQFGSMFYNNTTDIFELKRTGNYLTTNNIIQIDKNSNFCFSLEGFDKQDTSENKNGIKRIEVYQDKKLVFNYDITEIDFDKTRICNVFVDYNEMMSDNGYFYNCYQLKNNILPMYSSLNKGFFKIEKNDTLNINVFCYDYSDNKTEVKLNFIQKDSTQVANIDTTFNIFSKYVNLSTTDSILYNKIKIIFPSNCFYDDAIISLKEEADITKDIISKKYNICNYQNLIPLHKAAKIEFTSSISKNRNKIVIIRQKNEAKEIALKTTSDKNKFYTETKELGVFYLRYDTTRPTIEILNLISKNIGTEILHKNKSIQVKILDNLSGIGTYNGFIDGKWVNFYYDAKNDLIQYNLDEYCTKGEHILKLVVNDKVGNKTVVLQKFNY